MIKKLQLIVLSAVAVVLVSAAPVQAQGFFTNLFGGGGGSDSGGDCGETQTHLISCDSGTGTGAISDLIGITLFVMTILVGLAATGGLAYAAILYASARDNREKVSQALGVVRNVVLGLVFYAFTVAIINWLIPSGPIEQTEESPSPSASASVSPSPTQTP